MWCTSGSAKLIFWKWSSLELRKIVYKCSSKTRLLEARQWGDDVQAYAYLKFKKKIIETWDTRLQVQFHWNSKKNLGYFDGIRDNSLIIF